MEKLMYRLVRPALFSMNSETAHDVTMRSLRAAGMMRIPLLGQPLAPRTVMGLTFPNPVGLAAGLDKDGIAIDGLFALGFGFIELGTVTPRPQQGNPKPRMFRIPEASGIINRMGFNNAGVDNAVRHVQASRHFRRKKGILGMNIGKNADTPMERAVDDYLFCLEKVYPVADYVALNVSSPNTKDLRQLQEAAELDRLLSAIMEKRHRLEQMHSRYVPVALKIAPDMDEAQVQDIADSVRRHRIDAVIATNTTTRRDAVKNLPHAGEPGGLSGAPVRDLSTQIIRQLKHCMGDTVPIIGVGGIMHGADAREKMDAGAVLVQVLTGMVYKGPALIRECINAMQPK
ncbi:MAG: quinone-dependent dihydroorotate dehydrogenase [Burkholderiaceae bacterium]|nr:quinone-dependent dihydroorotate dehydrogenase [Burkholderiaceae bacterium]